MKFIIPNCYQNNNQSSNIGWTNDFRFEVSFTVSFSIYYSIWTNNSYLLLYNLDILIFTRLHEIQSSL